MFELGYTLGPGPNVGGHQVRPEKWSPVAGALRLWLLLAAMSPTGASGRARGGDGRPADDRASSWISTAERRDVVETFRSPPPCRVRCRLQRGGGGCRSRACGRGADCGSCACEAGSVLSACRPNQLTSPAGRPFGASLSMFVLLWLATCFSIVREALHLLSVCTEGADGTQNRVSNAYMRP